MRFFLPLSLMVLLSTSVSSARAEESGKTYRWYPSKTRFPEGDCVQVGQATNGSEYAEKVKPEMCRPERTSYLWQKDGCYEVDAVTQGQSYGRRVEAQECAPRDPEATAILFDTKKRDCWLVDRATQGRAFRRKATLEECRPEENELKKLFIPTPNAQIGGDCFEIHRELGEARWARKLDPKECRPSKTRFAWLSKGALKGDCWEMDEESAQKWSTATVAANCRPEKTAFRFERTSETSGVCWEVDAGTMGLQWALRTDEAHCRPE